MRPFLGIGAILALAIPLLAGADRAEERSAHDARLRHDQIVFQHLDPEQQERLRKLDRDLQEENPAMRARLGRVLQRYVDWLDRLPEADRRMIEQAPNGKVRLERVREIRQRQWIARLPRAQREQLGKAPALQRVELARKLWHEQWEFKVEWLIASRHDAILRGMESAPLRLSMLPPATQKFITENLLPLLSKGEEKRLHDAEGKWPRYPRTLVELADSHPLSVLGPIGPTGPNAPKGMPQLPMRIKEGLANPKSPFRQLGKALEKADGRWPEAGEAFRDWAAQHKKLKWRLDARYMPSHPHQFPPCVQLFLEKKLLPALDEEDRVRLKNVAGDWPAYPKMIVELAGKHNLTLPSDTNLPGAFEFWDRYRVRSVTAPLELGETYDPLDWTGK